MLLAQLPPMLRMYFPGKKKNMLEINRTSLCLCLRLLHGQADGRMKGMSREKARMFDPEILTYTGLIPINEYRIFQSISHSEKVAAAS